MGPMHSFFKSAKLNKENNKDLEPEPNDEESSQTTKPSVSFKTAVVTMVCVSYDPNVRN